MKTIRDAEQLDSVNKLVEHKHVTVLLPTGYGKTRVGQMAVELIGGEVLIVSSRVNLVEAWKKVVGGKAEVTTINSAYKQKKSVNLLIVDEAHRSLSPAYRSLYSNISRNYTLLLTATAPSNLEYLDFMVSIAPIAKEKTVDEALEDGAISDFTVYNIALPNDKSNGKRYSVFNAKLIQASKNLARLAKEKNLEYSSPFENAKHYRNHPDKEVSSASKEFWGAMTMRKQAVWSNGNKMDAVIKLVNQYPGRRWIIFFKSIKEAEICGKLLPNSAVYHSKMSKKAKAEVLERMETGKVSGLIGVDALNEGLDIPSIDAGISVSGDSSLLVFTQALGRTVRLGKDKKALFFNLYTEGTREEKWVKTKTLKIKPIWLKSIPTSPDTLGG